MKRLAALALVMGTVSVAAPAPAANPVPKHEWTRTYIHRSPLLTCIRSYEGWYTTNTGNGHYGAYQWQRSTWAGAISRAGYPLLATALPSNVNAKYQDLAALQLFRERGLQPWPTPARRCAHLAYRQANGVWAMA